MSIHKTNLRSLKNIIHFLNTSIQIPIPDTNKDIEQIYSGCFIIVNTLLYISKIAHRNDLSPTQKQRYISKIKDKEGEYLFTYESSKDILKQILFLDTFLVSKSGMNPSTKFISPLALICNSSPVMV